jgi:aspartate aminotransferase
VSQDAQKVLSARTADTILGNKEAWTRRMFELAAQMRLDGQPVYDLSLGNPSLEPPAIWREAIRGLLEDEPTGMHRYMTNSGYPEVRAFIAQREAARYGVEFAPQDVTMTVGAAGGLNVLFRAMLDPSDEIVVPAPYFSEYDHYCANANATLVPVGSGADFALDAGSIAAALTDKTRIVLLNSPNNPTGAIYEEADMAALAAVLAAHEKKTGRPVFVLEDSPYRDLVHDGSEVPSMLRHHPHTVFLTSHSKDLGLAGERIGYMLISPRAAGRELLQRAVSFANRILGFVNAPALMQRALPLVLGRPEGRVDVGVYARHCRRMGEGLAALGFHLPPIRAGFFLFPRLPEALANSLVADDPEGRSADIVLVDRLREARCVVVPGTAFGVPGHLRLSMCVDDATVDGALAAFQSVCAPA